MIGLGSLCLRLGDIANARVTFEQAVSRDEQVRGAPDA
jgi:hypothetical protein